MFLLIKNIEFEFEFEFINGIFCNNLGSLIWYHLCNLYARCDCLEIDLLYKTGFYLLFSLSKLRLIFEGGFYSRKYGIQAKVGYWENIIEKHLRWGWGSKDVWNFWEDAETTTLIHYAKQNSVWSDLSFSTIPKVS